MNDPPNLFLRLRSRTTFPIPVKHPAKQSTHPLNHTLSQRSTDQSLPVPNFTHEKYNNYRLKGRLHRSVIQSIDEQEYSFIDQTVDEPVDDTIPQPIQPFNCPVSEIVPIDPFVFVLYQNGLCAIYKPVSSSCNDHTIINEPFAQPIDQPGWSYHSMLNIRSNDIIRSIFYNQSRDEIMTVSIYAQAATHPFDTTLHPRALALSIIRSTLCQPDNSSSSTSSNHTNNSQSINRPTSRSPNPYRSLFALHSLDLLVDENLSHPGFVEFDEINQVMLSFSESATQSNNQQNNQSLNQSINHPVDCKTYKIWSLVDYRLIWSINQSNTISIQQSINPAIGQSLYEFPPVNRLHNQSINQPRTQSVNRSITDVKLSPGLVLVIFERQTSTQPIHQSGDQTPNRTPNQTPNRSFNQRINQSVNRSIIHSITQPATQFILFQVLNVIDGEVLFSYYQPINEPTNRTDDPLEYAELINQMLLIKLVDQPIKLIDCKTHLERTINPLINHSINPPLNPLVNQIIRPTQFVFLYEADRWLCVNSLIEQPTDQLNNQSAIQPINRLVKQSISMYSSGGDCIVDELFGTDLRSLNQSINQPVNQSINQLIDRSNQVISIDQTQSLIISYNQSSDRSNAQSNNQSDGCILFHDVFTGRLIGSIEVAQAMNQVIKQEDDPVNQSHHLDLVDESSNQSHIQSINQLFDGDTDHSMSDDEDLSFPRAINRNPSLDRTFTHFSDDDSMDDQDQSTTNRTITQAVHQTVHHDIESDVESLSETIESINQSINQIINQSTNPPIDQTNDQSIYEFDSVVNRRLALSQVLCLAINQSNNRPINQIYSGSINGDVYVWEPY